MDKVVSFTQLQGFWEEIRNLQQGFVTNLYWNNDKHAHWIEDGSLFYKKTEHITAPANLYRLKYFSVSPKLSVKP